MPCYSAWNEHLKPGTPEYLRAEAEVRAKLESIKHIVDYYYEVNGFAMPSLPDGVAVDPFRQPKSAKESSIREAICHHFACDEVGVSTLYDACSLLDENRGQKIVPTWRSFCRRSRCCGSIRRGSKPSTTESLGQSTNQLRVYGKSGVGHLGCDLSNHAKNSSNFSPANPQRRRR